jgi:hypothetical protein
MQTILLTPVLHTRWLGIEMTGTFDEQLAGARERELTTFCVVTCRTPPLML